MKPKMKAIRRTTSCKRCAHPECTRHPSFGTPGGKRTHCKAHAESGMEDVKSKRCAHPGCPIRPSYGPPGGKASHCKRHAEPGMEDVVHDRCAHPGCGRQPSYGLPLGKASHCQAHAEPGMEDVTHQRCAHPGCIRQPTFGPPGGKPSHCKAHVEPRMEDVVSKRCAHPGCTRNPSYGPPGCKPTFCQAHAEFGMDDVKNKRCTTPLCDTTATNAKYKGLCYRCFINTYPDSPIIRNHKTKERAVADFLREAFPDVPWVLDKRVAGGCSGRRPDLCADLGTAMLFVEVDEHGHRSYECENRRLMELFVDGGNLPILMVRINPDTYARADGARVPSCWGVTKSQGLCVVKREEDWNARLEVLRQTVQEMIERAADPTQLKEVDEVRLFYDEV